MAILTQLTDEIAKVALQINNYISNIFKPKEGDVLYQAAYHLLKAGGKRLRPFLVIKSCEAVGGSADMALPAAAAVELLHNFTLIHDDVMDQDVLRRGVPTVHTLWGVPMAILAGDLLFAKVFEIALDLRSRGLSAETISSIVSELAKVTVTISEGQSLDMSYSLDKKMISEHEYLNMISKKTAALFESSSAIGAMVGKADEVTISALRDYGFSIGMAFQIKDDVLGITSTEETLGKPIGSDIRGGKKTLIVIHALNNASESQRKEILKVLGNQNATKQEILKVINLLAEIGSVAYAESKARDFINNAKKALMKLPDSNAKRLLEELATFVVERRL
ncbi:MAG: polyprenyl synthetase family protein [Candidatus Methanomethylicota archaeon]|uniref:Polyprenyl synthetase family protein n=2 Tax=Thermoproteota archaeon TaxID=2056631 RepID=A0A497EV27_9CREN|nr:MAG: polyprenyl synthetase family protein [Candidatus Verstraetearchaeota archaeon]